MALSAVSISHSATPASMIDCYDRRRGYWFQAGKSTPCACGDEETYEKVSIGIVSIRPAHGLHLHGRLDS